MGDILWNKGLTADYVTVTPGGKDIISLRDYLALMIKRQLRKCGDSYD